MLCTFSTFSLSDLLCIQYIQQIYLQPSCWSQCFTQSDSQVLSASRHVQLYLVSTNTNRGTSLLNRGNIYTCLTKTVVLALKINLFVPSVPGHQLKQHVMILFIFSLFLLSQQIEETVNDYHSHPVCSALISSDHQLMCQSFV